MKSRMLRTTLRGLCPACGEGRLFAGAITLHATCAHCGVRYERHAGEWLGPTVLAYGLSALAAAALGFVLVRRFGFFPGLSAVLVAVVVAAGLLALRPVKAWWIWLMWRAGLVVSDEAAAADEP